MSEKSEIVVIGDYSLDVSAWPEDEKAALADQISSKQNPLTLYDPESGKHYVLAY